MAGTFSDYTEVAVLNHLFGKSTFGAVTPYMALHTADPLDAGSGTEVTNANAYARVAITGDMATATGTGGTISNTGAITFTACTTSTWGTVTHFAVWDSGTHGAGNMIMHGDLTVSKTVGVGDVVEFAIGDLDVSLT